jgi:hypothetical protein
MIWLETINIRMAGAIEAGKALDLCRQIFESIAFETAVKLKVFSNAKYATDISIHLEWKSDPGPSSVLGSHLVSAITDFGLISSNLWIEQEMVVQPENGFAEENHKYETG